VSWQKNDQSIAEIRAVKLQIAIMENIFRNNPKNF